MPPKKTNPKKQEKSRKDFIWTDDEAELLLNVTHDYKVQHLVEGTCWESVRTKYTDILALFRKELPENEEQARQLTKDYPHKVDEVTKEILTTKQKAVRGKFHEVCLLLNQYHEYTFYYNTIPLVIGC